MQRSPNSHTWKVTLIVITILALLSFSLHRICSIDWYEGFLDVIKLRSFLEHQFVEEVGLLRAATRVEPDAHRVYVASDNLLAVEALRTLKSPLTEIVEENLKEFDGGFDGLHEVLLGYRIPDVFYCRKRVFVKSINTSSLGIIEVCYEKPDKSRINYMWLNYADLIVYRALNELLKGNVNEAKSLFVKLMNMWDGYGFKDRAFNGIYETYKLALAVYLYRALLSTGVDDIKKYESIIKRIKEIIALMQRSDGGIITHYRVENDEIIPVGDANTETTSIVVISLLSNKPMEIGEKARTLTGMEVQDHALIVLIVIAAILAIFLMIIVLFKLIQ